MSDTPRTDAIEIDATTALVIPHLIVPADFARELERGNAKLLEDKARLDWLEQGHGDSPIYLDAEWHCSAGTFSSLRAAIDIARAKGAKS